LLLACLRSAGYVAAHGGRYGLTRAGRRWLDPASSTSVADFVAATGDYGRWWGELPALLRPEAANEQGNAADEHGSAATRTHATPAYDPYWRRYLYGQRDLARLTATAVARAIAVRRPRAMLDLGGGHGLYTAALCRRHPGLQATVLDLPGSAAVGREIVSGLGMVDRVRFAEGDVRTADLGTEYDLVCCFNLVHHLAEPDVVSLFRRVRAALAPGGVFAVLDAFPEREGAMASTDLLAMFVYLSSGARLHSPASLVGWLRSAGFNDSARKRLWGRPRPMSPRGMRLPQVPGLTLYQAQA
jgi:SAM-dependent methyltransferase